MELILDTNIFNWLIDGKFTIGDLPAESKLFASHIQVDEINRTTDSERRAQLMLMLAKHVSIVPTETMVVGVSRWGEAKLSDGKRYNEILSALNARNKSRRNNVQDSLIGEIALINGFTLVTADRDLASVMNSINCAVKLIAQ